MARPFHFVLLQARRFSCRRLVSLGTLAVSLLAYPVFCTSSQDDKDRDRPKLPYNMMGIQRQEIDAYDSKAEPVANATAALLAVNKTGWEVIRRYFPSLGAPPKEAEKRSHSDDPELRLRPELDSNAQLSPDSHFLASYANEDAALSPMPLLCIVWSLPESELSGRLKTLHQELAPAMALEDYSGWKLNDLRKAVDGMTNPATTAQGVKYRTPKSNLSFPQALRLYAMTIALLRMETKWADKADSPPPDMIDFTNRLRQQLPRQIGEGKTTAMFLYRPGVVDHPISKDEFQERADVVMMTRKATTVEVEQFPVYLTEDQREWSPSWIKPADEQSDTTLPARKYEHDWTRLDGPFLWFRGDQLDGKVIYRATVTLHSDEIVIEAERMIATRGAVKRVQRPRDYDPMRMTAFTPGVDTPAPSLPDGFMVDPPKPENQVGNLKRLGPNFSNSFRAWCAYGLWASGKAADGRTWVSVLPDEPRPVAPSSSSSLIRPQLPPSQPGAQLCEVEWTPIEGIIPYPSSFKSSITPARSRGRFIVELSKSIDSKKLKQGDEVDAKLTAVVTFSNRPPFARGTKVIGHVTQATTRSQSDPQSTLGVVFDKIVRPGGDEIQLHCVIQAVAPNPNADLSTGNNINPGDLTEATLTHSAGRDTARNTMQSLTETSIGVLGIKNIQLGPAGVLTSSGKEVKLDSGTRMLLNITMQ
ncbi:MAG: hypothetical protein WCC25_10780 [Candidatus Korobacteraceae bacterium]